MITQLVKIAEAGLQGDKEKVEKYMIHFIHLYGSKSLKLDIPFEEKLAKSFKYILEGVKTNNAVMDENFEKDLRESLEENVNLTHSVNI